MKPSTETILPCIRAWCRHYGVPDPGEPADAGMRFLWKAEFFDWLEAHTTHEDWKEGTPTTTWFRHDPLPVHPSHQWPGAVRRESRRETQYTWGMQIVLFFSLVGTGLAFQIDFDEENPDAGLALMIPHLFRVIKRRFFGGETKASCVSRALREKRGIAV